MVERTAEATPRSVTEVEATTGRSPTLLDRTANTFRTKKRDEVSWKTERPAHTSHFEPHCHRTATPQQRYRNGNRHRTANRRASDGEWLCGAESSAVRMARDLLSLLSSVGGQNRFFDGTGATRATVDRTAPQPKRTTPLAPVRGCAVAMRRRSQRGSCGTCSLKRDFSHPLDWQIMSHSRTADHHRTATAQHRDRIAWPRPSGRDTRREEHQAFLSVGDGFFS